MKTTLLAGVAAATLAATAPAFADWHNHGGNWNGGHHHSGSWNGYHGGSWRWSGSNWIWGAPLLGAAVAGAVLAAPYYGYRGYGYAPYYSYPTPLFPPLPRWCPGQYGGWFQC